MTTKTVRVENHQPVALRPIREVMEETETMWVGPIVQKDGYTSNPPVGWVRSGGNDEWIELEDTVTGLGYRNPASYMFFLESYGIDLDKTMARPLQPGEKLVIEIG